MGSHFIGCAAIQGIFCNSVVTISPGCVVMRSMLGDWAAIPLGCAAPQDIFTISLGCVAMQSVLGDWAAIPLGCAAVQGVLGEC
eukprot:1157262-Pelagomonas_calceolata.AAC.4